jgi:hypothetical protein
MAAFNFQLQGFPAANRDAVISLTQEATGTTLERKPFLDGSLAVRDLDPGFYQLKVTHPNVLLPIDTRRIRLFPQVPPTYIPIVVPEVLFQNNPIRDIPDADLGPVQQAVSAARDSLKPVGAKSSGEAIRAADWNTLVSAVSDLAGAVLSLTQLVSPIGHDHPEIADKIAEVQGNVQRFSEAFGRSLLELRREIETENLRNRIGDVFTLGGATADQTTRATSRIDELATLIQTDTPQFTQKLTGVGNLLLTQVNDIAIAKGADADSFLANPAVQTLNSMARQYSESGVQTSAGAELLTYQRTTTATGGTKLRTAVRP